VMAGIAMQTKYTAFVVPALIFIYGLQHRRVLLACFPGAIAATLFIAWESFMHWRYGISHFMYHLGWGDILKGYQPKSVLVEAIVTLIGGLTPAIALLGAAALGLSTFVLVLIGVVAVGGVVLLQAYDAATSIFFVFGIAAWIVTLLVATQLKRRGNRDDIFLLLWLTSEVIAYLAISPFAASRRAMGIVLVMALLASRLASLRTTTGRSLRVVRAIIACGMILGLTVYGLDRTEAMAQRKTVDQLALQLQPVRQPGEKVWFLGHGGFSYYAQRLGFESIVPDHSQLHRGDWLIEPKAGMPVQHVAIPSSAVEYTTAAVVDDPVQLSSLPFYAGLVPVTHRIGPRVAAVVYRVREDFILETTYDDDVLMKWAATRHRPLPPAAVAALVRAAGRSDPASAAATMNAISQSGPEAVAAALELPDARVRMWAANQLASMDPSAKSVLSAIQRAQHDADPSVRAAADRAVQHVAGFVDK
jgi:hypothetical protein